MCTILITLKVRYSLQSTLFKYVLTRPLRHWEATIIIANHVYAIFHNCSVTYGRRTIENWLSSISFQPTQLKATVERDAGLQFKMQSACSWIRGLADVFANVTLTHSKHWSQRKSQTSLLHNSISALLLHFHATGRACFQARHRTY